ncbi:MAG: patatin-like phospholipase family protein [Anaerolineales bacterium]|nr:patatin-like phospholipase family protein [Anaerolineales bacterium]
MKYDLVFEGGGAKGIVFVGAMEVFAAHNHTFDRLIGTSAGAITATLLAAGYTPAEMLAALNERQDGKPVFTTFMGTPLPFDKEHVANSATRNLLHRINNPAIPDFVENRMDDKLAEAIADNEKTRHFYSFVERGGWYSAHHFVDWLRTKLDAGTVNGQPRRYSEMNMAQFFAATGHELTLTGSDITGGRLLIFNHRTTPTLPIVWAVRMSMSVPLLWQEVIWLAEWGAYRGIDISDHAIVDGGLLSNFPIELLVSEDALVTAVMGEKRSQNVMGFLIDEQIPVPNAPPAPAKGTELPNIGELRSVQRIQNLVETVTRARDKMVIDAVSDLVVHLPAKGYGTTEFDMDDARRAALVTAGRNTMTAYLARPVAPQPKDIDFEEWERVTTQVNQIAQGYLEQ